MNIKESEVIDVYGYRGIYESSYNIDTPDIIPPGKVIFCEACHLRQFFETLKKHPERKIILVSCESDYSVVYQREYHSNADIFKCYYRAHWDEIGAERGHYIRLQFRGAEAEHCRPTDKFAAKIDGMTACTFPEIPDNVIHWFCANCLINEPRVHFLPFGTNTQGDLSLFETVCKEKLGWPQKLFYVNLDTNTYDRHEFKSYWAQYIRQPGVSEWATFQQETVPVKQFYEDIRNHEFVCCHTGNGWDSYRVYETLYLGRTPILKYDRFSNNMLGAGFPVILAQNWYSINQAELLEMQNTVRLSIGNVDLRVLTKQYWFDKIRQAAKDI